MTSTRAAREFTTEEGRWLIFDQGAQVVSWIPTGEQDVLWMSETAIIEPGRAVRGGIPICWPWFGPGRRSGMSPAHGFARTADWSFEGAEQREDGLVARYRLDRALATSAVWPYAYEAMLEVHMGRTLSVELAVTNLDESAFEFEEALHAYLRVGAADAVEIEGLDGCVYVDKTDDGSTKMQSGPVHLAGEVDRAYDSTGSILLVDPGLGRRVRIAKSGSASTVVWNPGADLAATMGDVAPGGWREFCCLEGGNVLANAVALEPGQRQRMSVTISVDGVFS